MISFARIFVGKFNRDYNLRTKVNEHFTRLLPWIISSIIVKTYRHECLNTHNFKFLCYRLNKIDHSRSLGVATFSQHLFVLSFVSAEINLQNFLKRRKVCTLILPIGDYENGLSYWRY